MDTNGKMEKNKTNKINKSSNFIEARSSKLEARIQNIHFIGIGGAGMSGLAKVLRQKGLSVSGSDIKESSNIANLRALGIDIQIGHSKKNIGSCDAVVISSAIREQNEELLEAKNKKIPVYQRAQMLALIAGGKNVIAVSGTHGKTTTTSMVSVIFENNGCDPTFLIGGELNDIGSNAKHGSSDYFIAEADESDGSLLHFDPDTLIITNIEADHLDFFDSFDEILALFKTFIGKIKPGGRAIVHGDDPNIKDVVRTSNFELRKIGILTYGKSEDNDFYYSDFKQSGFGSAFNVYKQNKLLGQISLKVPGEHNVLNALASLACAMESGLTFDQIKTALGSFSGVKRRFQFLGNNDKADIYDDYAHHPTEIEATLRAAANEGQGRIVCVFQPHRYSRTSFLAKEFGSAFSNADVVVITDVYSAGENPIPGVSGKLVVDAILGAQGHKNIAYMPKLSDVLNYLESEVRSGDLVITMGAGDISTVGHRLVSQLPINNDQ